MSNVLIEAEKDQISLTTTNLDLGIRCRIKADIQTAYRAWLDARRFRARRGHREMIASIARAFTRADAPRVAAIEAGTGTGKTAANALAAIPIAAALKKRLVIATATVALQEQIVLRDLPDLAVRSGLEFRFALAKGRGRYVCLKRLDDQLKSTGQGDLAGFETAPREAVARAMHAQVAGIDYDNFKNAVGRRQGRGRAAVYHDVWGALYRLQSGQGSPSASP